MPCKNTGKQRFFGVQFPRALPPLVPLFFTPRRLAIISLAEVLQNGSAEKQGKNKVFRAQVFNGIAHNFSQLFAPPWRSKTAAFQGFPRWCSAQKLQNKGFLGVSFQRYCPQFCPFSLPPDAFERSCFPGVLQNESPEKHCNSRVFRGQISKGLAHYFSLVFAPPRRSKTAVLQAFLRRCSGKTLKSKSLSQCILSHKEC